MQNLLNQFFSNFCFVRNTQLKEKLSFSRISPGKTLLVVGKDSFSDILYKGSTQIDKHIKDNDAVIVSRDSHYI